MAMPQPVSRESNYKTFTLEDYLVDDSPFKIGLEFERSDEEIKEFLNNHQTNNLYLELGPFSGFISIKAGDREVGDPSKLTYPAQHLAWLKDRSKYFLKDDTNTEASYDSLEILRSDKANNYINTHYQVYDSFDERIPILYRSSKGSLRIETLKRNELISFEMDKTEFEDSLNFQIAKFLDVMRKMFPRLDPKLRFYTG